MTTWRREPSVSIASTKGGAMPTGADLAAKPVHMRSFLGLPSPDRRRSSAERPASRLRLATADRRAEMAQRQLHLRQCMIALAVATVIFTVNAVTTSSPETRVIAGALTVGMGVVVAVLCFLVTHMIQARRGSH